MSSDLKPISYNKIKCHIRKFMSQNCSYIENLFYQIDLSIKMIDLRCRVSTMENNMIENRNQV